MTGAFPLLGELDVGFKTAEGPGGPPGESEFGGGGEALGPGAVNGSLELFDSDNSFK
jgi:hypothetical protein